MKIKSITLNIGPAIELEEYSWIKTQVSATIETDDIKLAHKQVELLYWKAVELDLRLAKDVKEAFDSADEDSAKGRKAIMKLAKKRIEVLSNIINKD